MLKSPNVDTERICIQLWHRHGERVAAMAESHTYYGLAAQNISYLLPISTLHINSPYSRSVYYHN